MPTLSIKAVFSNLQIVTLSVPVPVVGSEICMSLVSLTGKLAESKVVVAIGETEACVLVQISNHKMEHRQINQECIDFMTTN